jgi:putative CocE/NonD family hydrolase
LKTRGVAETDYDEFSRAELTDPFFTTGDYLKGEEQIDVPALFVDSWYDFAPGVVLSQRALFERNATTPLARGNQFALMSPSLHCNSTRLRAHYRVGDRDLGDPSYDVLSLYVAWFDHWLKGADNSITTMPKVQYYQMGDNRWMSAASWPIPESREVQFYLDGPSANGPAAAGRLRPRPGVAGRDVLVYDPAHPAPSIGGSLCCIKSDKLEGAYDQREVEQRPDVLTYSTGPLQAPVRLAGPVSATLFVSSDRHDTDFTVKLVDVYPDGVAYNLLEGVLRTRYRDGFETPKPMVPDEVYELRIPMQDIANTFGAGHQIRLEVSSSSFPRFDRNLNTGGRNAEETQWLVATNAVYHGGRHASSISFRVIDQRN